MRFLLWPFFFISSISFAQDSLFYSALIPRHALKVSPNHLFNFYPTIQLAYEIKVAPKFSLQLEGGYVVNYRSFEDPEYKDKRGVKTRLELHYYLWPRDRGKLIYYGAAELYWNAVNFDRDVSQTECFDIECNHTFTKSYTYTVMFREPGGGLKLGFIKYFSPRFFMDINSGWVVRFITYTDRSAPAGVGEPVNEGWAMFSIPNETDRTIPSPVVGIRFGYRIR